LILLSGPAVLRGQTRNEKWKQCGGNDPDRAIEACSAVIQSGQDMGINVAAAFYDRGIAHTHRRTGILVFVSTFERKVSVLRDVGVDAESIGEPWTLAIRALEDAVAGGLDFERFVAALRSLGPVLAKALPHHEGDANELPDEVDAS